MSPRNWINIPLLFLLAFLSALVFKSLIFGIAVTVVYLFYLSTLPDKSTRPHALMLLLAFLLICLFTLFDEGAKGVKDMLSVGTFVVVLFYTFGSFCILSPLKMLPLNNLIRYFLILFIACLFAAIHSMPGQGASYVLKNTLLYFVYLSAVYGLSSLMQRKKALPNSSASV